MTAPAVALLVRTIVRVRPGRLLCRVRLRSQRTAAHRWPQAARLLLAGPDPARVVGWPCTFRPIDACTPHRWPRLRDLAAGRIGLLGVTRDLGEPPDWRQVDAPLLWRFHLHYWDWAWGLVADRDRSAAQATFARLWRSWRSSVRFGSGDAWFPYPAALRSWSWCGVYRPLVAGGEVESWFLADLAAHAGFLRWHLESDLGGNHLVKELKALAGLGVFFGDEDLLRLALRRLVRQVSVQVLPDGGHHERSPAYHCQVLADLIDVTELLRTSGHPVISELTSAIARMREWLGAVLTPDGRVPSLNDGYPVDEELLTTLQPRTTANGPMLVLPDTGLVRAVAGGWHLLADIGEPRPTALPAHSHAGSLGCILHVDGAPLLVDTGTSTYTPGPVRDYERSTAAHNTVEVDGVDSTEVWGAFRTARRARIHAAGAHADRFGATCQAFHDGYRRLRGRPLHYRRWTLTAAGLRVDDLITGRGRHAVAVRWHLAADSTVHVVNGRAVIVRLPGGVVAADVAASAPVAVATESRPLATGFGAVVAAPVVTWRTDAILPVRITTTWSRGDGAPVEVSA